MKKNTHLENIIKDLSERDRLVLFLRFEQDLSIKEIAKILDITEVNVVDYITLLLAGMRQKILEKEKEEEKLS